MNPQDMLMVAAAGAFFDIVIIASYIVLSAMLFGVSVHESQNRRVSQGAPDRR